MRRERREFFPYETGKDPSSRARRLKRGSPGYVRDPLASSRVETGLSHVHTWWESFLGFNVKAVQGKQVPLEWTDTSGGLLEWWHDPEVPLAFPVNSASSTDATGTPGILSLRNRERIPHLALGGGNGAPLDVCGTLVLPFEWRRCLLYRCDGNAGNSFPTKQGKDPSSRARRRKRGSPECVRDPRASSRVETGLSHVHTWWESFLGFNVKAVQGKQVPLEWTGTSGGLLEWWHDPGVPLAFPMRRERREFFPYETGKDPSSRARRLKRGSPGYVRDPLASSRVETGLSHVHTWWESILGLNVKQCTENRFLWNGLTHLGDSWNGGTTLEFLSSFLWRAPPLEMRRERREFFPYETGKDPSSRARRLKRGSPGYVRDPLASSRVETGLSHVHTWCESFLGFNVKAVQGKQVPLEWTDTSGGLLEMWHDPGVPLAFPVQSASS
ncbi:hypothetical protein MJG53_016557 [Ovis ammon polii x Ovis aries]|uniref:Uncharacterized protein n=1 Tax=Ovis ammon polii x Ovis aries TaxID=2918886 RepID=A0ACB9U941_9CETA|nr:hypothetical protein MJG53_016557 [Ovis ammon polii x Ovis aries]